MNPKKNNKELSLRTTVYEKDAKYKGNRYRWKTEIKNKTEVDLKLKCSEV